MQFVQSIWLWAIAGIVVPIIIHLWNVRQGKTLKVGSIAFLTESAKSHSKSFKVSELLLLLIRCLILIILSFIICQPYLEKQSINLKEKGWIVIEKQQINKAYKFYNKQIDSLLKQGYTLHFGEKNFPDVKIEEALKIKADSINGSDISGWILLKELDQQIPSGLRVYVYVNDQLKDYTGSRPQLAANIQLQLIPAIDTTIKWLEKAYETTTDSIRVIVGNSNSTGTYFTFHNVNYQTSNDAFDVSMEKGKTFVTYKTSSLNTEKNNVKVDTSTTKIIIYTDRFLTDANYVKAALDAIKDFSKQKITTTITNNSNLIATGYDWLFWLSENNLPIRLSRGKVVQYAKGKEKAIHSFIVNNENYVSEKELVINKIIDHGNNELNAKWSDGFGNSLLAQKSHNLNHYYFYSRFNPQWNDLVWSTDFPQLLYNFIFDFTVQNNMKYDERLIDKQQLKPTVVSEETIFPKEKLLQKIDLTKGLWLIAFLLFLLERLLSNRRKKEGIYAG